MTLKLAVKLLQNQGKNVTSVVSNQDIKLEPKQKQGPGRRTAGFRQKTDRIQLDDGATRAQLGKKEGDQEH